MSAIDTLLSEIFATRQPVLYAEAYAEAYAEFEGWLRGSRRFGAFAHEYRNKIRAKLNNAKHPGSLDDLRAELQAAARLCDEQRFTVEYEPYAAAKQRGPDFSVVYKGHTRFTVEVRRMQAGSKRLEQVLAEKAKQLPAGTINLLWLAVEGDLAESRVQESTARLLQDAQRKNDGAFEALGYGSASLFLKQYQRLSAVMACQAQPWLWTNPVARHAMPADLQNQLRRLSQAK